MSQHTQDVGRFPKVDEQGVNAFFNSSDMEESNLGLDNALLGNIGPNAPVASVYSEDADLEGFNVDEIDVEALNANISDSAGLQYILRDQDIMQQQQSSSHEEQTWYNHVQPAWPNPVVNQRLQDARLAAIARTSPHLEQQWPESSHPSQTSRGVLQQPSVSPRLVQSSYAQTQTPWTDHEPLGLDMRGLNGQQYAAQQYTMSDLPELTSAETQGGLAHPSPVDQMASQSPTMATGKEAPEKSSQKKKQDKPLAAPKASAEPTQPTAAAPLSAMTFASYAEFQQASAAREIPYNYIPSADDDSFPKDQTIQRAYIRDLYDAYVDTTQCIDRATIANFATHWTTLSTNPPTSPITPAQITTICWKLLSIAMDLHTRGPICLNVYDQGKLKNVHKFRALTFSARISKLCELMRMSKFRCGSFLKLDGLEMVVATAPLLIRQTKTNYASNRKRQDDLVAGKEAGDRKRKAGRMGGDEDGTEEEEEGED